MTGVTGSTAAPTRAHETVTLKLMAFSPAQQAMDIVIANFERVYPDIHIEPVYLATTPLQQLLLTQLQSGNAPDVFASVSGNSNPISIYPLQAAGRLLDLSHQPWAPRVYKPVERWVSVHGKTYGFMPAINPFGLLYNTDVLRELGLSIPTTFSQLLAMCQRINAAGKVPMGFGLAGGLGTQLVSSEVLVASFVYARDPDWTAKRLRNSVTFKDSPLWTRALQVYQQMNDAQCFQPSPQGTTQNQQWTLVARGAAAMTFITAANLPSLTAINPQFKYVFSAFPSDAAKDSIVFLSGNPYVVNKATSYPKQAIAFINFLAREKQQRLFARLTYQISQLDFRRGVVPDYMKPAAPLFKAGKVNFSYVSGFPNPNLFTTIFFPDITGLFTGQKTVGDVLGDLDANWKPPS